MFQLHNLQPRHKSLLIQIPMFRNHIKSTVPLSVFTRTFIAVKYSRYSHDVKLSTQSPLQPLQPLQHHVIGDRTVAVYRAVTIVPINTAHGFPIGRCYTSIISVWRLCYDYRVLNRQPCTTGHTLYSHSCELLSVIAGAGCENLMFVLLDLLA